MTERTAGVADTFKYDVAFSLASEQAGRVQPIADELRRRCCKVFYYGWPEHQGLPSINFDRVLEDLYGKQTRLVVPVLSADYARKPWTGEVELRVVTELMNFRGRADAVFPLRADNEPVPGFYAQDRYCHLDQHNSTEIADAIEARLRALGYLGAEPDDPIRVQRRHGGVAVPPLPPGHIVRADELRLLQQAVSDPEGVPPALATALVGMGGVGKSTLAQTLCQAEHRPARFDDVGWIKVGPDADDLTARMRTAAIELGANARDYDRDADVSIRFRELLRRRRILLVLDDLWYTAHLVPFLVEHAAAHVVFTTRERGVWEDLRVQEFDVGEMTPADALALLRAWAERDDPADVDVVKRLGRLPLALTLAGGQLRRKPRPIHEWLASFTLSQLRRGGREGTRENDLIACFDLSYEEVRPADRPFYDALGILRSRLPETRVLAFWAEMGLDEAGGHRLLDDLSRLALIDRGEGGVALHDLLRDYAHHQLDAKSATRAHRQLLDSYGGSSDQWIPAGADSYYRRHSTHHFLEAGLGSSTAVYDRFDIWGWASSVVNWRPRQVPIARPPSAEPTPLADDARIALMGNWATGRNGAPVIAETLKAQPVFDLVLHLGDVFRSGLPREVEENFLAYWPFTAAKVSRSLNGNHDMYSGGKGYFNLLLPRLDQASSYFAFANTHWLLIGLDTAYETETMDDEQRAWLEATLGAAQGRRVVLFSHHYLFSAVERRLARRLHEAVAPLLLQYPVAAWYWSHDMNAVIYDPSSAYNGLRARSAGHGGSPVTRRGDIMALKPARRVDRIGWRLFPESEISPSGRVLDGPNDHIPGGKDKYAPHGYVTLTLNGPTLLERYHLPDGAIVWEEKI